MAGRYSYRIVFPVYYGKNLKGLVSRDFTGKQEPKYLNTAGDKGLFNCPKKKQNKTAILVEGIFDALAIERSTKSKDAMAVLGRSLTERQEKMLIGYERIILWPDSDPPGIHGMITIGEQLRGKFKLLELIEPSSDTKDAGEMSEGEIKMMLGMAQPFTTSLIQKLKARVAFGE